MLHILREIEENTTTMGKEMDILKRSPNRTSREEKNLLNCTLHWIKWIKINEINSILKNIEEASKLGRKK